MTRKPDIIAEYAKAGGPVPGRGSSIGTAFWRGYCLGPGQVGLRGGSPSGPAGRAFKAGLVRRTVQPALCK